MFQPIFLQIKGAFNVLKQGYFLMQINMKTFTSHPSYFVVGASFNLEKMDIDEQVLLVPSEKVKKNGLVVKGKHSESRRIQCKLSSNYKGHWRRFFVNKTNLASNLLEKFKEMDDRRKGK
jgi:hypothetical protein